MFDLIPEIVIAVFTETILNWIKAGVKAIQAFWQTFKALKAIVKLGDAASGVVRAFGKIGKVFTKMAGKVGGKIGQMFEKVMDFFRGLTKWGDEAADVNKTTVPGEKNLPETGNVTKTDNIKGPKEEPINTPKEDPKVNKDKTKGQPEDQLSDKGKNYPSPLKADELAKVNQWQNTRNSYLKKWREKDLSGYSDEVQNVLTKKPNPDNAIRNNMTPDDLAALLKEKRGVQITDEFGNVYNHMNEYQNAVASITKKIKEIQKLLGGLSKSSPDYLILQEKLGDLSNLKQLYINLLQ